MSENQANVDRPVVFMERTDFGGPGFGYLPEEFFEEFEAQGIVISAVRAVGAYLEGGLDAIISER